MNLEEFANRIALEAATGEQDGFVARETEEYLTKLEDELQRIYLIPDSDRDMWNADARKLWFDGFNRARETTLKLLKGEKET
jgi:hypothetical protein